MKKTLLGFMFLLIAVSLLGGCNNTSSAPYQTKSLESLPDLLHEGYILVDVREIEEFKEGHIEGATNIPLSNIEQGDYGTLSKNEKYVIICRSGNRSTTASDILAKEGFTVVNLSEGMSSWSGEVVQ